MSIQNSYIKDFRLLRSLITKNFYEPLHGEIDMYERIVKDCLQSSIKWYFWHDLRIKKSTNLKRGEFCIDFLLACKYGVVVIEVKGGKVKLVNGEFECNGTPYLISPLKQAEDYVWGLLNNDIINKKEIFVSYILACPHSYFDFKDDDAWGFRPHIWSQDLPKDTSFSDFAIQVLEKDKQEHKFKIAPKTEQELEKILSQLTKSYEGKSFYSETYLQQMLEFLNVSNKDIYYRVSTNDRLLFEGGPGTGKTTIAKAFILSHKEEHGLYLCSNKLLRKRVNTELQECENCSFFIYSDLNRESSTYDYIIIDEAEEYFKKIPSILNKYLNPISNGMNKGRYMIFYDLDQAHHALDPDEEKNKNELESLGAHILLDKNMRVPVNQGLVDLATEIQSTLGEDLETEKLSNLLQKYNDKNLPYFKYKKVSDIKDLIPYLKEKVTPIIQEGECNKYVVLESCVFNGQQWVSVYQDQIESQLIESKQFFRMKESNVNTEVLDKIPISTIFSYRGLEKENVVLILSEKSFSILKELYIGLSRAMSSIEVILLSKSCDTDSKCF